MGTVNAKGQAVEGRPHRMARIVAEPMPVSSAALHHMILNTETAVSSEGATASSATFRCELAKIEACEFIKWCRRSPMNVSEPQWFAMITNLAHLEGGSRLIHEISRLDMFRYDYQQTHRLIERVQDRRYSPAKCTTIKGNGFCCTRLGQCQVTAPMYLTRLSSILRR